MKPNKPVSVIVTCEHATCAVPPRYRKYFGGKGDVLESHRGWDPGTLSLGRALKKKLSVPLFATTATRLLVEVNRSLHHKNLFSEFTRELADEERQRILAEYYWPYRNSVEQEIQNSVNRGRIALHLSLHSFTPTWAGVERNAEIGLLYDSRRKPEKQFCDRLQTVFRQTVPQWRVRRNYPYLGRADGFTTHFRRNFLADDYLGIELEVNQNLMKTTKQKASIAQLVQVIANLPGIQISGTTK